MTYNNIYNIGWLFGQYIGLEHGVFCILRGILWSLHKKQKMCVLLKNECTPKKIDEYTGVLQIFCWSTQEYYPKMILFNP